MKTTDEKPTCQLSGGDGNVFAVVGRVLRALNRAGLTERAKEFTAQSFACESYDDLLRLCFEFVDVT